MGASLLPVGSLAKHCATAQIKMLGGWGGGATNVTSMMHATTYFCRLVLRLSVPPVTISINTST